MATNPPGSQPENQSEQQQPFQSRPTQPLYGQPQVPPPAPVQPYQSQPPQYYQPPASMTQRDPQTAMIIEIVAGLLGFLGIGYLYAGKTNQGIIRLIVWWVVLGLLGLSIFIAIGVCLLPIAWIAGPIVSGIMLKKELETSQGMQPAYTQPFTVQDQQTMTTPPQQTSMGQANQQAGMAQASQQICPHCGARNPAGARFCGECSTPLMTEALVPPATQSQPLIDQINYSTSVPPAAGYTPAPEQASISTPPTPTSAPTSMDTAGSIETGSPATAETTSQPMPQAGAGMQATAETTSQPATPAETGMPATTPPVEPQPLSGPATQPEQDLASTPPPPNLQFSTLASYEQSKTDDMSPSPGTGTPETSASNPAAPAPDTNEPPKDEQKPTGTA